MGPHQHDPENDRNDRVGVSRECFFSALFAKAKALSKKIHSCVSGGNVEKTLLLLGSHTIAYD